ncbi:MAG TPA: hypothetical protein VGJ81_04925 [Thermoanaerobaculia bacterium]|jgi:hypothetical protein
MQSGEERREFQRLLVDPPIPASYAVTPVSLIEIGVLGARLHHGEKLDRNEGELRFSFEGEEIALKCEVVRTIASQESRYPGSGTESGVRFRGAVGDSGDHLRAMLATLVTRALEAHSDATLAMARKIDGDKTVRGKDTGYICYRLDDKGWQKRAVFLPEQPSAGFTVARGVDPDEVQRLQRVYHASDEEGRRLIRLFAELSVSEALEIPRRA